MYDKGKVWSLGSGLLALALASGLGFAAPRGAQAQRFWQGGHHGHGGLFQWHGRAGQRSGAVYVLTDQAGGNSVIVYRRAHDGMLSLSGSYPTGGNGTGTGVDPLASQGALVLGRGNRLLFAVNAGSNDISEFALRGQRLSLLETISSGGTMPVSIAVSGGLVYVLNAGGTPNISGFTISPFRNRLVPLPHSGIALPGGTGAAPAEVEFSPDGAVLVVTEKGTNQIDTFRVTDSGYASNPQVSVSSGAVPFGFTFVHHNVLLVSEAGPNALSSYKLNDEAGLETITSSLPNGQTATCWVIATRGGRYAYTANAGTNDISSYAVTWSGDLRLLNPRAGVTATGSAPTDLALVGRYLYVRDGGAGAVSGFRVDWDGSLTPLGTVGGLPATTQGIAAR